MNRLSDEALTAIETREAKRTTATLGGRAMMVTVECAPTVELLASERDALVAEVRALRAERDEQRSLFGKTPDVLVSRKLLRQVGDELVALRARAAAPEGERT